MKEKRLGKCISLPWKKLKCNQWNLKQQTRISKYYIYDQTLSYLSIKQVPEKGGGRRVGSESLYLYKTIEAHGGRGIGGGACMAGG